MVTLESLLQLDPHIWPVASMAFLRVLTVFIFLPIFGDAGIPGQLRIVLAVVFTICLWPVISADSLALSKSNNWDLMGVGIATLREVFFGFTTGFAAKMITQAVSISSQLVGTNMGFQSASLFSPTLGTQESGFAVFKGWILVVCLLSFDVHHIFLRGLADSFSLVPFGSSAHEMGIANLAKNTVQASFTLGLRLAAPLLLVQLLVTIMLGLLNRAVPQLNAFIIQFPLSFGVSFVVLFLTAATFVRILGTYGVEQNTSLYLSAQRTFAQQKAGTVNGK
jgi:flagellar biosynthesis protein FliR